MVADQRAFDEAILLSRTRLKLPDHNLAFGSVEKITIETSSTSYQRPWSINGGFATVYKFRTQDGNHKALRCFRVAMKPDIKERYEQLSDYFCAHIPNITAGFHYYSEGLAIDEVVEGVKRRGNRAIILMDWINGSTLLDHVDRLCKQRNQEALAHLCERWLLLLDTMRHARIAHGDLSGENVMVRSDGHLVLVDYDGVYIPPFQGMAPLVSGQPNYQHPNLHQRTFDEHMDDFSGYVIYIALRALQVCPQLWDTYAPKGGLGKLLESNLLFTRDDFLNPKQSKVFNAIAQLPDPLLQYTVQALEKACLQPIEQVQLPVLDSEFRTISSTFSAVSEWNEERRNQCRRDLLLYAIHHQMTRDIILLSQGLEQMTQEPHADKSLRDAVKMATKQFMERFHPEQVTVQTDRFGKVFVRWQWPDEELLQFAVIAWRSDRSPHQAEESGTYLYQPISKRSYQQRGNFQFQVPQTAQIYLQVYFALPDHMTVQRKTTWIYSNNNQHATHCPVIRRRTSVLNA